MDFEENSGYLLYPLSDNTKKFYFNKVVGKSLQIVQENLNTSTKVLNTFGRYPFAYRVGFMEYKTFELTNVFIAKVKDLETKIPAHNNLNQFYELINNNEAFIVETPTKDKLKCFVSIKSTSVPMIYKEDNYEYLVVNIECTEIGSV